MLEYDIVSMPAWAAELFLFKGIITDDIPTIYKNKAYHPLDKRAKEWVQRDKIMKLLRRK